MNKVFLGIILAVCVLGMLLVMLNDRLGRKAEPRTAPPVAEAPAPPLPRTPEEIEANARALEIADAAQALTRPEEAARLEVPEETSALPPQLAAKTPSPLPEPSLNTGKAEIPGQPAPSATEAKSEVKPVPPEPKQVQRTETKRDSTTAVQQETEKTGQKTVSRFVIYARDKGATVRIGGTSPMGYSSMTLEDPERVVVDISGNWKFPANPGVPKNDLVSAVRVGQSGDKTRVVIDLKQKPRKVVLVPFKNGDGVDVRVDK